VLLIVSVAHLALFVYWEGRFARAPILPADIWKAPSFAWVGLASFLVFMSLGCYIWYAILLLKNIRAFDPIHIGLSFLPMAICGVFSSFFAAWAIPRLSAQLIIFAGCVGAVAQNLLLALTPRHQTYWAMVFPAMLIAAWSGDMVFAASQIIASSMVAKKHAGAAGSLIGTLFTYGLSTGLGFAGTVESRIAANGGSQLDSYRAALYLAVGFAGGGLGINLIFVRMRRNTITGWQGEDAL
jgi:MFS family permease